MKDELLFELGSNGVEKGRAVQRFTGFLAFDLVLGFPTGFSDKGGGLEQLAKTGIHVFGDDPKGVAGVVAVLAIELEDMRFPAELEPEMGIIIRTCVAHEVFEFEWGES